MAASGAGRAAADAPAVLDFLQFCGALKRVPRTGWVECGVRHVESVSDHSWRMALGALVCADPGLDRARLAALCIVHDLAEAVVGDLSPKQMRETGISKEDKSRMEAEAMATLCALLPAGMAEVILSLWAEYEAARTPEARWVKDMDKLEMVAQADEYEREQGIPLQTFFDTVAGRIQDEFLSRIHSELLRRRAERRLPRRRLCPVSCTALCVGAVVINAAALAGNLLCLRRTGQKS
eukprot:TRINITY_DN56028_c0_g1_i1.p1 TRINITY_DN56028_c0_g1~~TRINITY_DN56028_c0_g1_i1.p1  ORF type:complete len:237 (+),score=62.28 TRINITY_DN56028_c0_g1_i1:68-778(+)